MMKNDEKKLFVLHELSQESEPIGIHALLKKLGPKFVERSVRRWLSEMTRNGLISKSGNKKSTQYQVIHRSSRSRTGISGCFSSKSVASIEKIRKPLYERQHVSYNPEWLETYRPNQTFYIPQRFRTQLQKAGNRSKKEDPAGTYAHKIFDRLLIDLSYNSSRLEGNTYSLLDTERLLFKGITPEGKLEEEKVMILNHKEAIRYLVDTAPRLNITKETICTIHFLLSDGLIDTLDVGKRRSHGVRITGSTYIPIDHPKKLDEQMRLIVQKAQKIIDPYEQSFFLLVHVSYLQYFIDVNKRCARLTSNIPLIQHNLVPLSFNDVERDDYASALIAIYELQDVRPLLDLYMFSYMRTCAVYDATIQSIGFDEVRVRYRQERRALIRTIIEKKLTGHPLARYISSQAKKLIKKKDLKSFIQDVQEDLKQINESRIAGLGITTKQLREWLRLRS
jgi:hypothetical protein